LLHKNHHGLSLGPGGDPLGDPRVSSNTFKVEPITRFLPQKSGYQVLGLRGEVGGEPQINLGDSSVGFIVGLGLEGRLSD